MSVNMAYERPESNLAELHAPVLASLLSLPVRCAFIIVMCY